MASSRRKATPKGKSASSQATARKSSVKSKSPGKPAPKASATSTHERAAGESASRLIDKRIRELEGWRGETLARMRALILEADPEMTEEWKWMGTPVWSHQGMYALANAHKDKVKLTFFHGAKLTDAGKLFNAGLDGGKWRAIDFREGDRIDKTALKALLREAVAYNTTHSVPKSRGSRG